MPSSSFSYAMLGILVALSMILMAIILKPEYYKDGKNQCSPTYCYESNQRKRCDPTEWSKIPCIYGVNNECGEASNQSPINLLSGNGCYSYKEDGTNYPSIQLYKGSCTFMEMTSTLNVGRQIHTSLPETCKKPSIILDNEGIKTKWELVQFHFHIGGSEHTIDGMRFGGELHLVHRSSENKDKLFVIAIMLVEESKNRNDDDNDDASNTVNNRCERIQPIVEVYQLIGINIAQSCKGSRNHQDGHVNVVKHKNLSEMYSQEIPDEWNPYDFLPLNENNGDLAGAFFYVGSLTTPPCSTGVSWLVFDTPIELSTYQITLLTNLMVGKESPLWPSCEYATEDMIGNYRPIQNTRKRDILYICSP